MLNRRNSIIPIAFLMTCSLMNPSYIWADSSSAVTAISSTGQITQEQAEQTIKKLISIPSDYVLQSIHSNSGGYGMNQGPTWNLGWQTPLNEPGSKMAGLNVTVDANTGTIISLNRWSNDRHSTYPSQVDQQAAENIAAEFIQKLQPTEAGQVKLVEPSQPLTVGGLKQPVQYQIHYARMVNGVVAPFDGFHVIVNENGEIVSYQFHWSQVTFPNISKVISLDKANQTYMDSLQMHLEYQTIMNKDNHQEQIQRLVYKPSYSPFMKPVVSGFEGSNLPPIIDANTGKILDQTGKEINNPDSYLKPLSDAGTDHSPEKRENPLTQEEAVQIA